MLASAEKLGTPTFPWKSGPSGPRKAHGINAGFSPCGRVWRANGLFPQPARERQWLLYGSYRTLTIIDGSGIAARGHESAPYVPNDPSVGPDSKTLSRHTASLTDPQCLGVPAVWICGLTAPNCYSRGLFSEGKRRAVALLRNSGIILFDGG